MALMTPGDGVISACLDLLYNLPIVNRLAYKVLLNSVFCLFSDLRKKRKRAYVLYVLYVLIVLYCNYRIVQY